MQISVMRHSGIMAGAVTIRQRNRFADYFHLMHQFGRFEGELIRFYLRISRCGPAAERGLLLFVSGADLVAGADWWAVFGDNARRLRPLLFHRPPALPSRRSAADREWHVDVPN